MDSCTSDGTVFCLKGEGGIAAIRSTRRRFGASATTETPTVRRANMCPRLGVLGSARRAAAVLMLCCPLCRSRPLTVVACGRGRRPPGGHSDDAHGSGTVEPALPLTSGPGSTDFSGTTSTSRSSSWNGHAMVRKLSPSFGFRGIFSRHDGLPGGGTKPSRFPKQMTLFVISIPFMILTVALAVLPLILVSGVDHRRRTAEMTSHSRTPNEPVAAAVAESGPLAA